MDSRFELVRSERCELKSLGAFTRTLDCCVRSEEPISTGVGFEEARNVRILDELGSLQNHHRRSESAIPIPHLPRELHDKASVVTELKC
jgi:hypothetical protein